LSAKILQLLYKEFLLEWRNKYAINGIIVYILATVFTAFLCVKKLDDRTWNAVFWIILLFIIINAVSKSFLHEKAERHYLFIQQSHPTHFLISKLLYNICLTWLLSGITFLVYILLMPIDIDQYIFTIIALILGSGGLSSIFTFVAAIASRANNSHTLMTILSLPIVLPLVLLLSRISLSAFTDIQLATLVGDIIALVAIMILVFVLSVILFPYLWRD